MIDLNIDDYRKGRSGSKNEKNKFAKFLNKILILVLIMIISLISTKNNPKLKLKLENEIYNTNINFNYFKKLYHKYVGKYVGEKKAKDKKVSGEILSYDSIKNLNGSAELTVENNYLVPCLSSGIVVFIGNKDNLGNTIIVEGIDGIDTWYSNITANNLKMYDYITKGKIIGTSNNKLILSFYKDGKMLDYKKYI